MESKGLVTLNIDGKPLEKLIQVVSDGIGTLYRPRKIRKEADAQAYAIKVLENAKAEAGAESALIEAETAQRIGQRIVAKEIKRQENIDTIVEMAADNLNQEAVSDQPVDVDWATRFFDIVQDVTKEDMQLLWARILAKEIETPSSFSLRTLEVLRNITSKEAKVFEKVAQFILFQKGYFIYSNYDVLKQLGVEYVDIALLKECGFLQAGDFVTKNYDSYPDHDTLAGITYGKYVMLMTIPSGSKSMKLPVILLTKVGQEVFSLIESEASLEYIAAFGKGVHALNSDIKIQYAELISMDGNQINYKLPLLDL